MDIAVVDDEPSEAEDFMNECRRWAAAQQISLNTVYYASGEQFLAEYETGKYMLVFLDIYMNGMSGIETAEKLREQDLDCLLVFFTSSREDMPNAFAFHVFDYLVKPSSPEQISRVLTDAVRAHPQVRKYVELPNGRGYVRFHLDEIVSAVTSGHYLFLTTKDQKEQRFRMTAEEISRALSDSRFLSANKGIVVNMDYIERVRDEICYMKDGTCFPIWLRKKDEIAEAVADYKFGKMRREQEERM